MAILGTKKFWIPAPGNLPAQRENQILKNDAYINIQLYSVNYMSKGNFWQKIFGGTSKIALSTRLSYQSGTDTLEAVAVQDMREVRVNQNYNLGLQRNIALKVPAVSDGLALGVKMISIESDALETKLQMLNQPEYQKVLQMAPVMVGQILTISSMAKKLFTDTNPQNRLEVDYAGVISLEREDNPVQKGKLTNGFLILMDTNDGESFEHVDESQFELRGEVLYYKKRPVENTYVVLNISSEKLRGPDQRSNWFRKYNEAMNNLEKMILVDDIDRKKEIFNTSKALCIEAGVLLDADEGYIQSERIKIKNATYQSLNDKYRERIQDGTPAIVFTPAPEILMELTIGESPKVITEALPETGGLLNISHAVTPGIDLNAILQKNQNVTEQTIEKRLRVDAEDYVNELKNMKMEFNWNVQ